MAITNNDLDKQYMNFVNNVKYYRKQLGMTQEKLAEETGLSVSYIKQIESCKEYTNVTLNTQFKISKALNVKINNLFNDKNKK